MRILNKAFINACARVLRHPVFLKIKTFNIIKKKYAGLRGYSCSWNWHTSKPLFRVNWQWFSRGCHFQLLPSLTNIIYIIYLAVYSNFIKVSIAKIMWSLKKWFLNIYHFQPYLVHEKNKEGKNDLFLFFSVVLVSLLYSFFHRACW